MSSYPRFFPSQPFHSSPPTSNNEPTSSSFPHASTSHSPPTTKEQTLSPPFSIRSISQLQALGSFEGQEEDWRMRGDGKGELFPPLPWTLGYSSSLGSGGTKERNCGEHMGREVQRMETVGGERNASCSERAQRRQTALSSERWNEGDSGDRRRSQREAGMQGGSIAAFTPTNNLTDSPSPLDLPARSTTAILKSLPPSPSRCNSRESTYFTASECDPLEIIDKRHVRSHPAKTARNQSEEPISPTSTIRSCSPSPSTFARPPLSPLIFPTRHSRSPEVYPLSPNSLEYDTSLTSPLPFPQFSNFSRFEDPRSLTPMPLDPSFDKPRPVLYRTLPSGDYLPSRSMNRLRGVDEEMEPEELEWVEKSRRVRDDGTGRDWWGNPVGMGDWGRTILSPVWNSTEPTSSTRSPIKSNQLTSTASTNRSKTSPRPTPSKSHIPPSSRRSHETSTTTPSSLAERIEYDRRQAPRPDQDDLDAFSTTASKKEPVSGIAPSLNNLDIHDVEQEHAAVEPTSWRVAERERERKLEETRKWARKTAEAYLEQLEAERVMRERERQETIHSSRRGGGLIDEERELPFQQSHDLRSHPGQNSLTDPISTTPFERSRSKAHSTPPSSRPFRESPVPTADQAVRRDREFDHMASLDYAIAGDHHPLSVRGGYSLPLARPINEGSRHFDSAPDLYSPASYRSTLPDESVHRLRKSAHKDPKPQPTEDQVVERRRLRRMGVSPEAGIPPEMTKSGKREEAWNEWSKLLHRRRHLLTQLSPEPCVDDVPVLNALAQLHVETSNPATKETAEQFLLQSLQLDPAQPETNSMLAKLLESKDPHSAVQFHRTALRLDPSNPTFHLRLASALEISDSAEEALETLDGMARTFPSTRWEVVARHRAGMLALGIGEKRRAKQSLRKALEGLDKVNGDGREELVDLNGPTAVEMEDLEREVKEALEELEKYESSEISPNAGIPQDSHRQPSAQRQKSHRRSCSFNQAASPPPSIESITLSPPSNFKSSAERPAQDRSLRTSVPISIGAQPPQSKPSIARRQRANSLGISNRTGEKWTSPDFDLRRRDSLSPSSLSSSSSPRSVPHRPSETQQEAALPQSSQALSEALRALTLITRDRTTSHLAHETRQVSEAMDVVFQLLRASTQEELERNEELLRSLRDLCQELEKLPGNLGERAKLMSSRAAPTPQPIALPDPIEVVRRKLGTTKKLLGVLFPSLS